MKTFYTNINDNAADCSEITASLPESTPPKESQQPSLWERFRYILIVSLLRMPTEKDEALAYRLELRLESSVTGNWTQDNRQSITQSTATTLSGLRYSNSSILQSDNTSPLKLETQAIIAKVKANTSTAQTNVIHEDTTDIVEQPQFTTYSPTLPDSSLKSLTIIDSPIHPIDNPDNNTHMGLNIIFEMTSSDLDNTSSNPSTNSLDIEIISTNNGSEIQ